jgi:hypothetical protein
MRRSISSSGSSSVAIAPSQRYEFLCQRMLSYRKRFEWAIALFEFSTGEFREKYYRISPEKLGKYNGWRFIAGRDGAMSLYHFRQAMTHANSWAQKDAALSKHIDRKMIKCANAKFDNKFPYTEKIRHSVSHSSDLLQTEKEIREHFVPAIFWRADMPHIEKAVEFIHNDQFDGRLFVTHFGKALLSYELSEASLQILEEIERLFFGAYSPPVEPSIGVTDGLS